MEAKDFQKVSFSDTVIPSEPKQNEDIVVDDVVKWKGHFDIV